MTLKGVVAAFSFNSCELTLGWVSFKHRALPAREFLREPVAGSPRPRGGTKSGCGGARRVKRGPIIQSSVSNGKVGLPWVRGADETGDPDSLTAVNFRLISTGVN